MNKKIVMLCKKTEFCQYAIEILHSYFNEDEVLCIKSDGNEKLEDMLLNINMQYLISYLSPWIVNQNILDRVEKAAINFHPGSPDYPGTGCYNFALYEQAEKYGVTCHHMKAKVDTGNIILTSYFSIGENETVDSLKLKSMNHMLYLFEKVIYDIATNKCLPQSAEKWRRSAFTRKQLNELTLLDPSKMSLEEMLLRIKATQIAENVMYGPYVQIADKKFYYCKDNSKS